MELLAHSDEERIQPLYLRREENFAIVSRSPFFLFIDGELCDINNSPLFILLLS